MITMSSYLTFLHCIYYTITLIFILSVSISNNGFSSADFVYADFNNTAGLIFVGAAGTSNCWADPTTAYGDVQGKADLFDLLGYTQIEETTDAAIESNMATNIGTVENNLITTKELAGFLHRQDTIMSPENCTARARLTPSNPSTTGAVWARESVPVNNGFETKFTFQISDHSKECSLHRDQYFTPINHKSCSVHGGDGFAFVIQRQGVSSNDIVGSDGGQMGFGGISNSLAIAFDTWQNPGEDRLGIDHVSIQSRGVLPNDALELGLLGVPRTHALADGVIHMAKITYFADLRSEYLDQLVASESLLPFLKDNGEQKRLGTLVVWMDDGIASDVPLLALPINLSLLLDLPDDNAFVGFTSSTGRFYEKHDILSWHWCDQYPCLEKELSTFDYFQQSSFNPKSTLRQFTPGPGYGGGDNLEFPTRNRSPDTDPWSVPVEHFASARTHDLSDYGHLQVPPNTLY